jgi:hypothetical protein
VNFTFFFFDVILYMCMNIYTIYIYTIEVVRGKSVRPANLNENEEWFDENPLCDRQLGLIAFTLFVLFQVVLVAKLDGAFHGIDWVIVMVPYYVFEVAEVHI